MLYNLKNIALGITYSILFIVGYKSFLYGNFEYMGFKLNPYSNGWYLAASILIAVLPLLFFRGIKRTSSFIAIFIYLLLYVPIILTFGLGMDKPLLDITETQSIYMLGMSLILLADRIYLVKQVSLPPINSFKPILIMTILCSIYMLIKYHGNLQLVGFGDVYEQRSANNDIGQDLLTSYLSSWLATVMIPICLTNGLFNKAWLYYIVGTIACVIMYMATANKIVIIYPFVFLGFYHLFSKGRINNAFTILVCAMGCFMVITLCLDFNIVSSLLWMRTIGNGGLLSLSYYNFFSNHPHTYFTHINLINNVTHMYPYGNREVGQVVGQYFWSEDMNANANFWAIDGLAALGLSGVLLVSIVVAIVFMLINNITRSFNSLFVIMCLIPFLVAITNTSFFSSLWTGGAIILMLFFTMVRNHKSIAVQV